MTRPVLRKRHKSSGAIGIYLYWHIQYLDMRKGLEVNYGKDRRIYVCTVMFLSISKALLAIRLIRLFSTFEKEFTLLFYDFVTDRRRHDSRRPHFKY